MIRLLFPVFLLPVLGHAANVLCTVAIPGSHFFVAKIIAEVLLEEGHNVTLASASKETRTVLDPRIRYVTPTNSSSGYFNLEEYFEDMDEILSYDIVNHESNDMGTAFLVKDARQMELYLNQTDKMASYYVSEEFLEVLETGNFDLIIAEDTSTIPIAFVNNRYKIPFVGVSAITDMSFLRDRIGLPSLFVSEFNFMFPQIASEAPGFLLRLRTIIKASCFYYQLYTSYMGSDSFNKKYLEPFGLSSFVEGLQNVDLYLVNSHPVTSFPYLTPLNAVFMGSLLLNSADTSKPLPERYTEFVNQCSYPNIIYVSFGSYLWNLTKIAWIDEFVDHLAETEACIIFKATYGVDPEKYPKEKFLIEKWVPQKALFSSNLVTFFISHCGNNGRMEAIFYNVPVLCIPLFADQLGNALLVERNNFGKILYKEAMSRDDSRHTFLSAVREMLANREKFHRNMKIAREIMDTDPSSSKANMLFYLNHLIKHGNLDFLTNEIIQKQSLVEIYCLDVFGLGLMLALTVVYLVYRMARVCYGAILRTKEKVE